MCGPGRGRNRGRVARGAHEARARRGERDSPSCRRADAPPVVIDSPVVTDVADGRDRICECIRTVNPRGCNSSQRKPYQQYLHATDDCSNEIQGSPHLLDGCRYGEIGPPPFSRTESDLRRLTRGTEVDCERLWYDSDDRYCHVIHQLSSVPMPEGRHRLHRHRKPQSWRAGPCDAGERRRDSNTTFEDSGDNRSMSASRRGVSVVPTEGVVLRRCREQLLLTPGSSSQDLFISGRDVTNEGDNT